MSKVGYIKFYRRSLDHWLNKNNEPLSIWGAWLYITLTVNYKEEVVELNNEIVLCGRGQSLKSYKSWAEDFNWTASKVRRFFKALENDGMLRVENLSFTTRITVLNFNEHQAYQPIHQPTPNKEYKEEKNNSLDTLKTKKEKENPPTTKEKEILIAHIISWKIPEP